MTIISSDTESAARPDSDVTIDEYFRTVRPDVRVRNALMRAGYTTMAQLCEMSDERLMRIRNFGAYCLAVVVEERQKYLTAKKLPPRQRGP